MDIVSNVRNLFPDVTAAVEQYKQTKPDREVRNLARRLANEEALYDQFIRKLSLLPAISLRHGDGLLRNVESRLGSKAANDLESDLHQMEELLRGLRADLTNTSRGTEVLAKFRRTTHVSRGAPPRSPLQKRLDDLSRVNKGLAAHLLQGQVSLPFVRDSQTSLDFKLLLHLHQHRSSPSQALHLVSGGYICNPQEAFSDSTSLDESHSSFSDVAVPRKYFHDRADIRLVQQSHRHISVQAQKKDGNKTAFALDSYSTFEFHVGGLAQANHGNQETDTKSVYLSIETIDSLPPGTISFEELILRHGVAFSQKRRIELAFRLSSMVLLMWSCSPILDTSTWESWVASFDLDQDDELCGLYLKPSYDFSENVLEETSSDGTGLAALGEHPVLTLLGLRLTELAFGRTLAEMRDEKPYLLPMEEANMSRGLLDLLTVKRLLALHRIGEEAGQVFEEVITICLNQQYRERKGARVTELDSQNEFFLERAAVAILIPLYQQAHKYAGCTCNRPEVDQGNLQSQEQQMDRVGGHHKDANPIASIPGQLSSAANQVPDGIKDVDAFQLSFNAPGLPDSLPVPPKNNANERIMTFDRVYQTEADRGKDLSDSHRSYDVIDDPQHQSLSDLSAVRGGERQQQVPNNNQQTIFSPEKQVPQTLSTQQNMVDKIPFDHRSSGDLLYPQTKDVDAETICSYETIAGTTDSAFPWLSEHSDEPPNMPDNHPLLSYKDTALSILLIAFRVWRACGNGEPEPSSSTARTDVSRKRARTEVERNQGDDYEEGDDRESNECTTGVSSGKRKMKEPQTFSCPFLKKDANSHGRCCAYVLKRIRDVKQHLARRHQIPIYCPRCLLIFTTEDNRDAHIRDIDCERAPRAKPEGITDLQRRQLAKKAPAKETPEEQWYGIFYILFPKDTPRPESPYIDSGLLTNVLDFHSFSMVRGPRILNDVLTASGAVTWNLPSGESSVPAFQRRVLQDGIQAIFEEWTNSGGISASELNAANSSSRSVGASSHDISAGYNNGEGPSTATSSSLTASSSPHVPSLASFDEESGWLASLSLEMPNFQPFPVNWGIPFTSADTEEINQVFRGAPGQAHHNTGFH